MKRLLTLILTLTLLLTMAAFPALAEESAAEDEGAAWPVLELKGAAVGLYCDGYGEKFRYQTFSGPGDGYSLAGAYLPRKVTVMALGRENGYALLDVEYKYVTGAEREEIAVTPVPARTNARIAEMFYGPGNQYDVVRQRTKSRYANMSMAQLMKIFNGDMNRIRKALRDVFPHVEMVGGARVSVLYEVNGWVCIESDCTVLGKTRTWVPADQVTAE